ncbi:MAG: STAS domain-containing protein [Desulfarculales bacterium]|jgi:anti-sigma B factor antagonist|nr:STAS domain-containing protein [Desulfarculales bacterium]
MTVIQNAGGKTYVVALAGRIDTITAHQVKSDILSAIDEHREVILDFGKVEYVSSAGLRVLLITHKHAQASGGRQTLRNISPEVMEVFAMTGFTDVLNIE